MISLSGDLRAWSAAANSLFAPGCESQAFMLLSSFASPLMHLIRGKEGGALVSLYGGKKSGKSTAIAAAASVWGNPADFSISSLYADDRFKKLAELQHLPAIHESLERRAAWAARSFLRDCFVAHVPRTNLWKGTLLSVTSIPIFPTLTDRYGVLLHVGIELPLTVPKALTETKHRLEYDMTMNCGHAGMKFTEWMMTPNADVWARQQITSRRIRLKERFGLTEDLHRHALNAVAGAFVAGVIVAKLNLLEFDPEAMVEWAASQAFAHPAQPSVPESSPAD